MNDTKLWGIEERYEDAMQQWHEVSEETKKALLRAMRADESAEPEPARVLFVTEGRDPRLPDRCEIELEDGSRIETGTDPARLPLGYHTLRTRDGQETRLIVTPQSCYLREHLRLWGWTVQLYALRSARSWGMGDLEDLRQLSTWSSDILSAGILMTNPLDAASPGIPQQTSPYYPSSRLFRNFLYLRIEEVPGAQEALPDLERWAARGRALNAGRLVDRDAIYKLKREALEAIWSRTHHQVGFADYEREQGRNLDLFAVFCVLAEQHGPDWHKWPQEFQNPESAAVRNAARDFADRVRYHKWIQWLLDRQLLRASERRNIMQDLPIGVDPGGADAWLWQDFFAANVSVGAPPDPFSATGQDWGLPPFIPHKLRSAGYEPFIQMLRSAMRHSAALRIDHVMGLFRLFWVPAGASPKEGAYVRYEADEMLAILALESVRAKAFVVGEDLGTVEPGVREKLSERRILSYRVLWFEEKHPAQYPELSLASISTHDLPTIAGIWSGADLKEQKSAGMEANEKGLEEHRKQLENIAGVDESAPLAEVIVKAHEALAEAPSAVILATLDDPLGVEQRPNLPGSTNEHRANWSIALPKTLEEIETDPAVFRIAKIFQRSVMARSLAAGEITPSSSQSPEQSISVP